MSIQYIKSIFENISTCSAWSLQIIKITHSSRNGISYLAREIQIEPVGRVDKHIKILADKYLNNEQDGLGQYTDCRNYDGSSDSQVIYKLDKSNHLISQDYELLIQVISTPDTEINPLELKTQASVVKGTIRIDNQEVAVKFISMQNPITTLKNKFWSANGTFHEISDKVLTLRNSVDVIIVNDTVYMLNLSGEKLFNMERSYNKICLSKVELISQKNIIDNFDIFKKCATSGHNPRKFVSFNDSHLEKLVDTRTRKQIAAQFNIKLTNDRFDASEEGIADKIVKLLCQRGMLNPFDAVPMEVSGSRKWT